MTFDNKKYFNYSLENPDEVLDFSNPEGIVVVSADEDQEKTEQMLANDKLIDLITTYQTLCNDPEIDENSKQRVVLRIISLLDNAKSINYSSFCAYFQVLGYSYSSYKSSAHSMSQDQKIQLMERILDNYIKYRHNMYKYLGYSNIVIQVMSDMASSRRKGVEGINKIREYLDHAGFIHATDVFKFNNSKLCYLLPDKGDKDLFDSILIKLGVNFTFRDNRQNKMPDVMIKINNDVFVVEQKITNGEGGAQNEAINEIIDFVRSQEDNPCVHFVSCLQGDYFKNLKRNKDKCVENKSTRQYKDIIQALNSNDKNCFVNENGLEKMIEEAVDYYNKNYF